MLLVAIIVGVYSGQAQSNNHDNWPELNGPYLGQNTPKLIPEVFAPQIISTDTHFELNAVFSPDGRIFMFSREVNGIYKMFFSTQNNAGTWSEPRLAGPSKTFPGHRDVDMFITPKRDWLYFISDRPLPGYSLDRYNILRSRIGRYGIETPEALGSHINGPGQEMYPIIVGDGSLYFTAQRDDSLGGRDSYKSQFKNGKFEIPINLGSAINSANNEGDIFVNQNENMIIHVSFDREDSFGAGDLYISFKDKQGKWSKSVNMGSTFNSPETDYCPMMSHDGKYFFFSRGGKVMWVSSESLLLFKKDI
jgi:hypothetical protein